MTTIYSVATLYLVGRGTTRGIQYMSVGGIHLAVHTDEALLSTGAWMDFSQHVHTLVLRGDLDEATTLWVSVFVVVHMGVDPTASVLQSLEMPNQTNALLQDPMCQM